MIDQMFLIGRAKDWMVGDHARSGVGMVKVVVDLTGCGFTSAPIVQAMLNGENHNIQTKVSLNTRTPLNFMHNVYALFRYVKS